MKVDFYTVVSEFCSYPKTDDLTLDFFNFLEERYPSIWSKLSMWFADDWSHYDENNSDMVQYYNPRLGIYGWDITIKSGNFNLFLSALKYFWGELTEQTVGVCFACKKESDNLQTEHSVIVSFEFAPIVKYYEAQTMDGAVMEEKYICRECAIGMYKKLVDKANPEGVECWV